MLAHHDSYPAVCTSRGNMGGMEVSLMQLVAVCLLVVAALLSSPGVGLAACTTRTVFTPNGTIIWCTTCCVGSHCTTTCS